MSLKYKIKTIVMCICSLGLIFPLIALCLMFALEEYYGMFLVLAWVWVVMNLGSYFTQKSVTDAKYNDCSWEEYRDFVENGYTWLGRRAYLYKGTSKDIELTECLMADGSYQEALEIINALSRKSRGLKEIDRYKLWFLKCSCLWLSGKTEDFFIEKEKGSGKGGNQNSLKLEIYEKISRNEIEEAENLLQRFTVDCRYNLMWKQSITSLFQGETKGNKPGGERIPKIKVKFPIIQIAIAVILVLAIGAGNVFIPHGNAGDEKKLLYVMEEGGFKIEVRDAESKFHFLVYDNNEDGQYRLIHDWKHRKTDIWEIDFDSAREDETLKKMKESEFSSVIWLYIQSWNRQLRKMEEKPDFLLGVSRNSEIQDIILNGSTPVEADAVETEEETWYFYHAEVDDITEITSDDIMMKGN